MVTLIRWVDRIFRFDFPVTVYPCILERLRGTPARLEELIRSVPGKILTERVDGKWSLKENAGHLWCVDELLDGRIDDYLQGNEVLRPADMSNRRTGEMNFNASDVDDVLAKFRGDRMKLVKRLEQFDDESAARSAMHPRLKVPMRVVDMAYFFAEHDDQHFAIMRKLAKS